MSTDERTRNASPDVNTSTVDRPDDVPSTPGRSSGRLYRHRGGIHRIAHVTDVLTPAALHRDSIAKSLRHRRAGSPNNGQSTAWVDETAD